MKNSITRLFVVFLVTIAVIAIPASGYAFTYNVNTTADGTSAAGTVNLRGAIQAADALGGSHTINVPAGTYTLTLGAISLGNTAQNLTIVGAGAGSTSIVMGTGANQDRIFNININLISNVTTTISGLTFSNGYLKTDPYGGGAILAGGPSNILTINNCTFSNNTMNPSLSGPTAGGGAICYGYGGSCTINQCTFTGNSVQFPGTVAADARAGGAIYFYNYGSGSVYPSSDLHITNCTFSSNSVSNSGRGGAVFIKIQSNGTPSSPVVTADISKNIFLSNSASGATGLGGAISSQNDLASTSYTMNFNRFFGNTAGSGNGSALYMEDNVGNIDASNNWWGCNSGPTSCADKAFRSASSTKAGVLTSSPYLQLKSTASSGSICANAATTITSGFTSNSASATISSANLTALTGTSISFTPSLGAISGAQTTIQSSGTATATYTAGATAGAGSVNPVVDNVPANDATAKVNITVNAATVIGTNPSNASSCSGLAATFTVAATGSSLTYQWYKGATLLTNGATGTGSTIAGATSQTLTITNPGASDAATNYNVVVNGTCGSATSTNASLTVGTTNTWIGGSSSLWSNPANWSCGAIPTSTVNVVIPNGTPNSPQVNITTATANNLTINAGASLSFSSGSNVLDIKGNLSNSGTFNPSAGKVIFSGSTQSIAGGAYGDIQINGSGSKTLTSAATVSGTLTLTDGLLLLGSNNLTIGNAGAISGGSATSFVVTNSTGRLVQQNIGSGGRTGAISFPVGAVTTSYTPISLNNSGAPDAFSVGVLNAVYSSYDASDNPTSAALTTNAISKTWLVSEGSAGGSTVTATFQWNSGDELSGFTRTSSYGSHYVSGAWQRGTISAAGGSNPYTQTLTGISSFSPFGVGGSGSPLPTALLAFSGKTEGKTNILQWTSGQNNPVIEFTLERSVDAATFRTIASLLPEEQEVHNYTYSDQQPGAQSNYYRLKMMLKGGGVQYSDVVALRGASRGLDVQVSPNPFHDAARVNVQGASANSNVSLTLFDAIGRIVARQTAKPGLISISGLEALSIGVYTLEISCDGVKQQVKMSKTD